LIFISVHPPVDNYIKKKSDQKIFLFRFFICSSQFTLLKIKMFSVIRITPVNLWGKQMRPTIRNTQWIQSSSSSSSSSSSNLRILISYSYSTKCPLNYHITDVKVAIFCCSIYWITLHSLIYYYNHYICKFNVCFPIRRRSIATELCWPICLW
jgi:hypothetical protein